MIILIIAHYPATAFGARKAIESFFWKDAPLWGSILIVYVLIGVLATLAISIKELATVLDFTSSLAGSFVILMLPAAMAFYINRDKNLSLKHQILPVCCFLMGAANFTLGLGSTIWTWFRD